MTVLGAGVDFAETVQPLSLGDKIQGFLDGADAEFIADVKRFLTSEVMALPEPDISLEDHRTLSFKHLQHMIDEGFSKLHFPKKYGGEDDLRKYLLFVALTGYHDLSFTVKQGVDFTLLATAIMKLGTEKHFDQYLPDLMNGDLFGGLAMTEVGGGSNVQGLQTEAIYDHESRSFILNTPNEEARKAYIGNAAQHGDVMTVYAQLKMGSGKESKGVHAFLVPIRDQNKNPVKGVMIEDCGPKEGLNGVDNGYLSFDHVKIPYDAMFDRFSSIDKDGVYNSQYDKNALFFKTIGALVTGRALVSSGANRAAEKVASHAWDFIASRKVFGVPLQAMPATQKDFLPHLANIYAGRVMEKYLLEHIDDHTREYETIAATMKFTMAENAIKAVDSARLLTGGHGYVTPEIYGKTHDDLDVFQTFEGPDTVLRIFVAKNRLSMLGKDFGSAHHTKKDIVERRANNEDGINFLDSAHQAKLFVKREGIMLKQLDREIKSLTEQTQSKQKAALIKQLDMLDYADAYAEQLMLNSFIDAVQRVEDPEVEAALKMLCDLYAVHTLNENALWYVQNSEMNAEQTKELQKVERELYRKVVENTPAFIEGLSVPRALMFLSDNKKDLGYAPKR